MAHPNTRIHRLLAGSLIVIAVAVSACSPAASATPGAPASAAQALILTAAFQPDACMDALLGGTLVKHAQSGLGVGSEGVLTAVEWPFRYSARLVDGRLFLLDETGKVVAREGDEINVGGGFGNEFWHACAPVSVTRAAT
jgi:hypothetical protein